MTYTPGPWRAQFHVRNQRTKTGEWIFSNSEHVLLKKGPRSEPDARLIVAAPDLLEALKWLVEEATNGKGDEIQNAIGAADAAIARAEGKQ